MRTLVTGSGGFLGGALVGALRQAGDEVTGFDVAPGSEVRGDLAAWPDVLRAVESCRPERIFHRGALLSAIAEADVPRAVRTNATGTFNVLEGARLMGVSQVVFTSTVATFGADAGDPVPEGAAQHPTTIYGVTKVYCERLGEYYARRYGLDFRGVRLPSVIGPGRGATGVSAYSSLMIEEPARGRGYVVPLEPRSAMPILYIDDAVRALLDLAAASGPLPRAVYNIAGISPSAEDIADAVRAVVDGASITFEPDAASQAVLDSWPVAIDDAAARADWGWTCDRDLKETVSAFVEAITRGGVR
jgi:threonine 3-dehydrogenase